ncbi:MAG: 3-oxoacyl-ACP reductase FabG [Lentisphaeraceae bacterium]|nr:3-oxoacyl-ACP reductase FabG [Lentisphaeraceae bacterium]
MKIDLSGKVAIVTGSSQGIGRATVEALVKAGAKVVMNKHNNEQMLKAVAAEITSELGGTVVPVVADVTKKEEAQKLIDAALELGSVDILVNNAGGLIKRVPIAEFDEEHFHQVMDVNLLSTFIMCKLVLPHMKSQGGGSIINLSSQAAHDGGGAGSAVYSSSKGATTTMTKSLAKEVGPDKIRANCISPGFIGETTFHDTFTAQEVHENVKKIIPLRRHGAPEDVANSVVFLASEMSAYITGQSIDVNGGLLMP